MAKVRITKEFHFEMAHALMNYDGKCRNIHGHSYRLFVTIIGEPISEINHVKLGMLMDFGDLKNIVKTQIVDVLDHALLLNAKQPIEELQAAMAMFERCEYVNYQPTCENMVIDFAERIQNFLDLSVKLHSIKLYETATSYAEWFASDNG